MPYRFTSDSVESRRTEIIDVIRDSLVVSVQAPDGHPMRDTPALTHVAQSCVEGGATAIRCGGYGGVEDIRAISEAVNVPVFGLTKEGSEGVYITPTRSSVISVIDAGAAIVCADATSRARPDGSKFSDLVEVAHAHGALIMADCATPEDAYSAAKSGADFISTTLAGYTEQRTKTPGPDLECLRESRELLGNEPFLIGEGRFHTPSDIAAGRRSGADALIVGTAITDPTWITSQFRQAVNPTKD